MRSDGFIYISMRPYLKRKFNLSTFSFSITDEKTAENICADEGLEFDRTRVVNFQVVKANSNEMDTNPMTLLRREAVLEVYKKDKINFDF